MRLQEPKLSMALVSVLLVTNVLVLAPLVVAKSGDAVMLVTYPDSDNFSSIQLSCVYDMSSGPQTEGIGAKFQLNGTDIKEEIDEVEYFTYINDTVHFILTPEKEGFFTCSLNGSLSINSIGLAGTCVPCLKSVFHIVSSSAQPSTNYSGQSVTHEVELPDDDSSVSTELQCDIQPGAMRQRYSVQWIQVFNSSDISIAGDMFNLTLTVNSTTNGSLYQCCVTINHNGSGLTSFYNGRLIVVITTEGNDQLTTLSLIHNYNVLLLTTCRNAAGVKQRYQCGYYYYNTF